MTLLDELIRDYGDDPIVRKMVERGYPLTREMYVALNWGPRLNHKKFLGPEWEEEIPEPLRRDVNDK